MQKKDTNFQPLGICHKLFNFIMNSLIARGLKRISTGRPTSHDTTEMPTEESSRNGEQPTKTSKSNGGDAVLYPAGERPKDNTSSEIIVELLHANGFENWTTFNEEEFPILNGGQTQLQKGVEESNKEPSHKKEFENFGVRNGISLPHVLERTDAEVQGTVPHELKPPSTNGVPGKGPKNAVDFRDSAGVKKKSIASLGALYNINEKSDAFIRSRKEAYSLEPRQS